MTDEELKKLISQRDEIDKSIEAIRSKASTASEERYKLEKAINDEWKRRYTENNLDDCASTAKQYLTDYVNSTKAAKQIWIVEIDGKRYTSKKSKNTWTSYENAKNAIIQHIYYYVPHADRNIDMNAVADKLISDGTISIKQVY